MADGTTLDAALAWAARGFRVFPLRVREKRPLHVGFMQDASTDPAAIREAWGDGSKPYNIGVLTHGMIVVDIDDKNGKNGSADFASLGYPTDGTIVVRTPSGGRHVYYSGPNRKSSAGQLAPGLDIRSWGGYVLAPGSVLDGAIPENRGSDGPYTLVSDVPVRDGVAALTLAPADLIRRLPPPDEARERKDALPLPGQDSDACKAVAVEYLALGAPIAVEGESGDIIAYTVAARLKDLGVSEPIALDLIADHYIPRCVSSWPVSDQVEWFATKVANAYQFGTRPPGVSSPEAMVVGISLPERAPYRAEFAPKPWARHGDEWQGTVTWLYHETFPNNGVVMLVAPSGAGKTFLALHLARSLATGSKFFGVAPEDVGGTALLLGEGSGGIRKRMAAMQHPGRLPIYATGIEALANPAARARLEAVLREMNADMLATHDVPLRMVILDTLSASGILEDENDNAKAAAALKALEALAANLGVVMVIIHHPTKTGNAERGAGSIRGNVEVLVEILREPKAQTRHVEITKAREAVARALGNFTLLEVVLGLDAKDRQITSCVVAEGTGPTRSTADTPHSEAFVQAIEHALTDHGEEFQGKRQVEEIYVRSQFIYTFAGKPKTVKAATAAFDGAKAWARTFGGVNLVEAGDRVYYSPLLAN